VFGTDMNQQMAQFLQAEDNILQGVTGQAPFQMGYDALVAAIRALHGEELEPLTNTPTIFFGRGDDELINQFVESDGMMLVGSE